MNKIVKIKAKETNNARLSSLNVEFKETQMNKIAKIVQQTL